MTTATAEEFQTQNLICTDEQCDKQAVLRVDSVVWCVKHLPCASLDEAAFLLRTIADGMVEHEGDIHGFRGMFKTIAKSLQAHHAKIADYEGRIAALEAAAPNVATAPGES